MSQVSKELRTELEGNYEALVSQLDALMPIYGQQFALMRHGEVVEFYSSWEDAYKTGAKFYPDGLFSVQQVTKAPVDLGYFSHAVHIGDV